MDQEREYQTILYWTLPRQWGGFRLRRTILTPGVQVILWLGRLQVAWIVHWLKG